MDELSLDKIVEFLSDNGLFRHFDNSILRKVAVTLKVVILEGGQFLMKQHEIGNSLYIVYTGRLRASICNEDGIEMMTGDIGFGEIVGEIALILGEPRRAAVRAIRDSILLEFTKEHYDFLSKQYPQLSEGINQFCIKRLLSQNTKDKNGFVTIAFVPAGNNPYFSKFVPKIASLLEETGGVLYLNKDRFNELYGKIAAQSTFDSEENARIVSWLHKQELNYRYVIYETDTTLTQWTLRCLRQVDQIVLVGLSNGESTPNEIESKLKLSNKSGFAPIDLVLLHTSSSEPTNTINWLKFRSPRNHYHIRIDSPNDYARFMRFLTGHALGLVLAGGGLRSVAYIGLFRALEELKIEVDMVGANSSGSLLAGLYAKGIDHRDMKNVLIEDLRKNFKYNYTYPAISLFTGKFLIEYMQKYLDDTQIEDLWKNFFCTSYNLSINDLHVHDQGILYQAIRASCSIPGLFPPVINDDGEMFVDGVMYNNLPIETMKKKIINGKILAIDLVSHEIVRYDKIDLAVSGWELLFEKMFVAKENRKKIPSIGEVIFSSMISGSLRRGRENIKQADYFINLDVGHFKLFQIKGLNELINASYVYCLRELEGFLRFHQK